MNIEAQSQEEFDAKRPAIIKALAGTKFDVVIKSKTPSVYDKEKPAIAKRQGYFTAQNQMMDYWDGKFEKMLKDIKSDIGKVLK